MNRTQILDAIREIFCGLFGSDPSSISATTSPEDVPAWDSLGHVELSSRLQERFSIVFDIDELMEMETVGHIAAVVDRRLAGSAATGGINAA